MRKYTIIVLLTGLCSCGIYRQNVVNTPLMQQKGQTQLGGHIGFNGLDGQAAYALTNHIAVLANYSDMGTRKEQYSPLNYSSWKHRFKEAGAGVYQKTASGQIRELYVFAGKGTTSHLRMGKNSTGVVSSTNQDVDYSRFVIQANFGGRDKKFEHVITPRLLGVDYYHISDNGSNDYRNISRFHVYAEGALTIRYHLLEFLMISGQGSGTLPITHPSGNDYYEFSPFSASIGLIFNFNLLKTYR